MEGNRVDFEERGEVGGSPWTICEVIRKAEFACRPDKLRRSEAHNELAQGRCWVKGGLGRARVLVIGHFGRASSRWSE